MLVWDDAPLEAVLLDLDDTLLDHDGSRAAAADALAAFLAERLGDVPAPALRARFEAAADRFWRDDARRRSGRLDMDRARCAIVEDVLAGLGRPDPPLAAEAVAVYSERRDASWALFDGALEALVRLRARAPALGLVTNGAAAAQRAKIERFDLARHFDVVVVEGELGCGKPDRRVFAHALGALGVDRAAALMAGDDFACDVVGALEAGLHACWIDPRERPCPPGQRAPRPHRTLPSFVALAGALGA